MRCIVFGAGAVGGVVGARLAEHGRDVILIARGAHGQALRQTGLTIESPDGRRTLAVRVAGHPEQVEFADGDVVLLAVKSQHTREALTGLRRAPRALPIACMQNGVENERSALRFFDNVYGLSVMCPAAQLVPGVVQAFSSPVTGILDIGRYPAGTDATAQQIAHALGGATFSSLARADIMRWKYAKLLANLGNAVEAICGPGARNGPIGRLAREEGAACLRAAGIGFASDEEDAARRGDLLQLRPVGGRARGGGSMWQSLQRQSGSVEADYLNGEIVLLGRRHGVPAPANELLQQLATTMAADRAAPGSVSPEEFLARLAR